MIPRQDFSYLQVEEPGRIAENPRFAHGPKTARCRGKDELEERFGVGERTRLQTAGEKRLGGSKGEQEGVVTVCP